MDFRKQVNSFSSKPEHSYGNFQLVNYLIFLGFIRFMPFPQSSTEAAMIPICTNFSGLFFIGQTKGPPPSPAQVSIFSSPPAQMKEE